MDEEVAACGQLRTDIREPDVHEQEARSADCECASRIAKQLLSMDVQLHYQYAVIKVTKNGTLPCPDQRSEHGPVAQLVRAPPCHGGGHGFESRLGRFGILAQLGEHLPYKQRVIGSSPIGPIKYGSVAHDTWLA